MKLLDYPALVRALGISRSKLEEEVRLGRLVPTRIGRRVLFAPQDINDYVERHRAVPSTRPRTPLMTFADVLAARKS